MLLGNGGLVPFSSLLALAQSFTHSVEQMQLKLLGNHSIGIGISHVQTKGSLRFGPSFSRPIKHLQ